MHLYVLFQIIFFLNNFYPNYFLPGKKNREEKKKKHSSIHEFEFIQRNVKREIHNLHFTACQYRHKLSRLSRRKAKSYSNREAEPIHPHEADNRSTGQDLPTLESKCLQGKMRDSSRSKSRTTTTTTTTATSLANRTKRSLHVLTALIDKITGTEYRFLGAIAR